jgi:DNA segregation ATPase FtsK/SpoIIIE-like protein
MDLFGEYDSLEKDIEFLVRNGADVGIYMILSSSHPNKSEYGEHIKGMIPVRACLKVITSHESIMAIGIAGAEQIQEATDFLFKGRDMVTPMQIRAPLMSDGNVSKAISCAQSYYSSIQRSKQADQETSVQVLDWKENKLTALLRRLKVFFGTKRQ